MSRPDDKKVDAGAGKRAKSAKRALALSVALLLAAAAVWWFGTVAAVDAKRAMEKDTAELNRATSDMQRSVGERERMKREFDAIRERIRLFDGALLKPQLGSYAMGAKDLIERLCDEMELPRARFENLPTVATLPPTTPAAAEPYVRRRVKVTVGGSFQKLVGLLCRVERLHPCVLTESVSISAAGAAAGEQLGTFVFNWLSEPDGQEVAK